jgi:hypothetical protein
MRSEVRRWERLPAIPGIDNDPLPKKSELALEKSEPKPAPPTPLKAHADRVPELGYQEGQNND